MNKLKLACTLLLATTLGTSLCASDNLYAKINAGIADVDAKKDNGNEVNIKDEYTFGVALGKEIGQFDIELEFLKEYNKWQNKTLNSNGDGKSTGYYINGYYNFDLNTKYTPYLGAGIGRLKYDDSFSSETDTSYQAMLGCSYEMNNQVDLNVEYRYRTVDYSTVELTSNNIMVGAKFKF